MSATLPVLTPQEIHEAAEEEVIGFCEFCDGLLLDGDDYDVMSVAIPQEGGEDEVLVCARCILKGRQRCC